MPFSSRVPLVVPDRQFRLSCPKCHTAMDHRKSEEFGVDVCSACGVMWFDPLELKVVLQCEATASEIDDHEPQRDRTLAISRGKKLLCPRDEEPLVVREHVDKPQVDIDQCPSCRGILLDAGELRALAARSWRDKLKRWWSGGT